MAAIFDPVSLAISWYFLSNFVLSQPLRHLLHVHYLNEGHPRAFNSHHSHSLAQLQVQDEDFSGIKQQHVVPFGRQVGQLQTVVECHSLRTTVTQSTNKKTKKLITPSH